MSWETPHNCREYFGGIWNTDCKTERTPKDTVIVLGQRTPSVSTQRLRCFSNANDNLLTKISRALHIYRLCCRGVVNAVVRALKLCAKYGATE